MGAANMDCVKGMENLNYEHADPAGLGKTPHVLTLLHKTFCIHTILCNKLYIILNVSMSGHCVLSWRNFYCI
jgi:hypothetical protein